MKTPITEVAPLMPHSGRMMLIDCIIAYDSHSIITESWVDDSHIFAENGYLPVWALIEIMAQSIAALGGALAYDAGEEIRLGFLLGSRHFCLYTPDLPLPVKLRGEVRESTQDVNGFGVYDCCLYAGETLLANAALNVFCPPENNNYTETPDD